MTPSPSSSVPGGTATSATAAAATATAATTAPASRSSSAISSSSSSSSANVTPLDSAAALHLLLSPDGYYRYLNVPRPSDAGSSAPGSSATQQQQQQQQQQVDHNDAVKKNYRRLSLRHHPDRPGGDADTFRVLNRAKRVLTNPRLRRQYDLLGLDLDDDDEDHHEEGSGASGASADKFDSDGGKDKKKKSTDGSGSSSSDADGSNSSSSSSDSAMSHIASATIATIIQVAVRTAALGISTTLVCRYKILCLPAVLFMMFVSYRVRQAALRVGVAGGSGGSGGGVAATISTFQTVAPLIIASGLILMHYGRGFGGGVEGGGEGDEGQQQQQQQQVQQWSFVFWLGETAVMTMFVVNSIQPLPAGTNVAIVVGGIGLASTVLALILRGKFWRYACLVAFEAVLAFLAVLAFPIMEMILEEIMNEKLRKIGEQVRAHARRMDAYAEKQASKQVSSSSMQGGGVGN